MEILRSREIRLGKRAIIEKAPGGYRVRTQENRSIIGQYAHTDAEGWRDCMISFESTIEQAIAEMNRRS